MNYEANDVQAIFFEAMDKGPVEREEYLRQACGGNLELRAKVEKLLDRLENVGDFLAEPFIELEHGKDTPKIGKEAESDSFAMDEGADSQAKTYKYPHPRQAGDQDTATGLQPAQGMPTIPGYEILRVIARGGMGIVYQAKQVQAKRIVALKMILSNVHANKSIRERFRTEAEAIARLQHPGIVQIFDVGEHQGNPYFSLEYCSAGNLGHYLSGTPLPARQAAELVRHLAQAIQAAHETKVIHRDLKPANVLFAPRPGVTADIDTATEDSANRPPLSTLIAKVTDFGLAKKLDDVTQTRTGMVMGTPSYMSPEQARGNKEIGPLTDVYSLGTILYECLTGRPPFKAASSVETIFQVTNQEPATLRQLQPNTPRDLETICLKGLQKEPSRRYQSAGELADDLARFLEGKPILARPVSTIEKTVKWIRRHPALASLLLVTLTAVLLLIGGGTFFTVHLLNQITLTEQAESNATAEALAKDAALKRALQAEKKETERRKEAEAATYAYLLNDVQAAWDKADLSHARKSLSKCERYPQGWEYRFLNHLVRYKGRYILGKHDNYVKKVAWSPDGKLIASGNDLTIDRIGKVKIWDVSEKKEIDSIRAKHLRGTDFCFSPDSQRLAITRWEKTIKIWDIAQKKVIKSFGKPGDDLLCACYSPDGKFLAGGGLSIQVWDTETGQLLFKKTHNNKQQLLLKCLF